MTSQMILGVVLCCSFTALVVWLGWLVRAVVRARRKLRRAIFDSLDAAAQNGYFEQGEQLHGASSRDIACDLTCFASELENYSPETLLPHVRAWSRNRGIL